MTNFQRGGTFPIFVNLLEQRRRSTLLSLVLETNLRWWSVRPSLFKISRLFSVWPFGLRCFSFGRRWLVYIRAGSFVIVLKHYFSVLHYCQSQNFQRRWTSTIFNNLHQSFRAEKKVDPFVSSGLFPFKFSRISTFWRFGLRWLSSFWRMLYGLLRSARIRAKEDRLRHV